MTVKTLVSVGPSLMEGTEPIALPGNFSIAQGGKGAWPELVAERLSNLPNVGPLNSSGLRGCWLGDTTAVSYANSWSAVTGSDLFDKAPYGVGKYSASGTTAIITFTRSKRLRPVVGFYYYWIDLNRLAGTQGGIGSYRIDGGSWTALPAVANDNAIKRVYVSSAVTSTVEVRAATAAGVTVAVFPVGIEWAYRDLSSVTDGFVWHNLGANGAFIRDLVGGTGNTTVGDRMAIFELINPNAGILMLGGRDVTLDSTSQWNTDLTTFEARADNFGPVWFMDPYELSEYPTVANSESPGYPFDDQASYRSQTKTTATAVGATGTFDLFDEWQRLGLGGQGAQNVAARTAPGPAFIYNMDNGHELQNGHLDIARRVYGWLKDQLGYTGTPAYVAKGTVTAQQMKGGQLTKAYAAGAPIAVTPV